MGRRLPRRAILATVAVLAAAGVLHPAAPLRAADASHVAGATPAVATEARLVGDDSRTRLVIDLSHAVTLGAFTLADPYRVVIDIPDVVFNLPVSAGREGKGLVNAYRFGLFAPGRARIVIDVTAPVVIDKAFVLDPLDDQPARLVVDLTRTDRTTFLKSIAAPTRRPADPAPAPKVTAEAADPRPVIVLDPGHGGIDSGAFNAAAGIAEKTVVLEIARALCDRLAATGRYRPVMTRDDDSFVPLGDRVRLAREQRAALFISLHADSLSARDSNVRGATIYTLSDQASDAEAQRLADDENKADMIAGVDLSDEPDDVAGILLDLTQRETRNFSGLFARTLAGQVANAARMHKSPLRAAGFKVLKAPDVPSVLFELGYLSSRKDLELMTSPEWQAKMTKAMVEAIDAYFASRSPGEPEDAHAAEAVAGAAVPQPAAMRP